MPRLHLSGHVVAAGRPVRRSSIIDGGDDRSIDISKLVCRHGGHYLYSMETRYKETNPLWPYFTKHRIEFSQVLS